MIWKERTIMLLANRLSKINYTKKYPAQSQNSTDNSKGCGKCHFKSFKYLNSFLKDFSKTIITHIVIVIPHSVKYICQRAKCVKLTTIYANIPNKAVKKASKKVLKNSIFIFVFSNSIKGLYHNERKYNV